MYRFIAPNTYRVLTFAFTGLSIVIGCASSSTTIIEGEGGTGGQESESIRGGSNARSQGDTSLTLQGGSSFTSSDRAGAGGLGGATTSSYGSTAIDDSAAKGGAEGASSPTSGGTSANDSTAVGGGASGGMSTVSASSGGNVSTSSAAEGGTSANDSTAVGGGASGGMGPLGGTTSGGTSASSETIGGSSSSSQLGGQGCSGSLEERKGTLCVAKMVRIGSPATLFQIDATEVTQGQYDEWAALHPIPEIDSLCRPDSQNGNQTHIASCSAAYPRYSGVDADKHPAVCVDWCDARDYCTSIGKRLCGGLSSGADAYRDYNRSDTSEWYHACVSGATGNSYPYGSNFQAPACNGAPAAAVPANTVPAGQLRACSSVISGFAGVYDLSGNVSEWENACADGTMGSNCRRRGGNFSAPSSSLRCDTSGEGPRLQRTNLIGFRCCAN